MEGLPYRVGKVITVFSIAHDSNYHICYIPSNSQSAIETLASALGSPHLLGGYQVFVRQLSLISGTSLYIFSQVLSSTRLDLHDNYNSHFDL